LTRLPLHVSLSLSLCVSLSLSVAVYPYLYLYQSAFLAVIRHAQNSLCVADGRLSLSCVCLSVCVSAPYVAINNCVVVEIFLHLCALLTPTAGALPPSVTPSIPYPPAVYVCMPLCVCVCQSGRTRAFPSYVLTSVGWLSLRWSIPLCLRLCERESVSVFVYPCLHVPHQLPAFLPACLPACLSVCLPAWVWVCVGISTWVHSATSKEERRHHHHQTAGGRAERRRGAG